jgi:hypothetical protein
VQAVVVWSAGLLWIGGNDFEIVFFAEREESIVCPASGVDSAECGTDAGVFFDEGDAEIEIAAAEEDVVE